MKKCHTSCHRGKRVRLRLKTGEWVDDRFVDATDRWLLLEKAGKVLVRDVKAFIVLKSDGGNRR